MAFELRLRRGTTAEHATFTGKQGELTVDTTKNALVLHDGLTPGGKPIASADPQSIDQDANHMFVTDAEKQTWNEKISRTNIADTNGMIGFVNPDSIELTHTVNDLTMGIISATAVYKNGVKYNLTESKTIDLTSEVGLFYIGYDVTLNQLYKLTAEPDFGKDILVARVYKNAADGILWVCKANHSASRNSEAHKLHNAEEGLAWISGGELSYLVDNASDVTISLTSPVVVADEDLFFSITNTVTPSEPYEQTLNSAKLPVVYVNADAQYAEVFNNGTENFLSDGTRAVINTVDHTGVGSLTTASSDTYIVYWLIATTDQNKPIKLVLGRVAHGTIESAENESFNVGSLPIDGIKVLNKFILHCNDTYSANAAKVVIHKVYDVEYKRNFKILTHNEIASRNVTDAHTIESITGLRAELDALSGGAGDIELTTAPMLGLIWNQTDDTYLRIAKNVNVQRVQGYGEFSTWKTNSSDRQNDNDTGVASPLTKWLDTSANLPYSSMKRKVVNTLGVEAREYNADSFAHPDQTSITATEQVMVKVPEFHYIDVTIVDAGKTYVLKAIAKETFSIDLANYDFISPVITAFNPIAGVSSGTIVGKVITSALHPCFVKKAGLLTTRYYGAFNAVSGRSICGSGVKATGTVSRTTVRTQCRAFGTYFNQLDFQLRSAIALLAVIERGSFFMERGGASLNNKWEGYSWRSGATSNDQDNGLTLPLGNRTGVVLNASNQTIANNYRGIENYHSALWQWVDGVNINNNKVYLSKVRQEDAVYDDTSLTTNDYFDSGLTVPSGMSASYLAEFHPGTIVPKSVGGSATQKVTDAGWSAGGLMALAVGGSQNNPSNSGLVTWSSNTAASATYWYCVGRPAL